MQLNQSLVPSVSLAGVTIPTNAAKIMTASSAAPNYESFRHKGAFYQVPAGKTLRIWACRIQTVGTAGGGLVNFGYSDSPVSNSASAPSGQVNVTQGGFAGSLFVVQTQYEKSEHCIYIEIPAGKYPFMNPTVNTTYAAFLCEEV